MVRIITYLAVLALLVTGAVWLANDPGTAVIDWRGWRIDTSASVLIGLMIAAVIVVVIIWRLVAALSGVAQAFAAARRERRLNKGLASLADGFAAVEAGQTKAARRFAKEASALLKNNPAVQLLRKEAAALAGDAETVKDAAQALLDRPQTELVGLRALALKAQADGDAVGALALVRRALSRKDAPAWAVHLALDLEIAGGRWREALELMEMRVVRETFSQTDYSRIKTKLLLQQAQVDLKAGESHSAAARAKQAIDLGGAPIAATVAYARAMTAQGKGRKAAGLIEKLWGETPHADLAAAYRLLVPGESALDWARRVDSLARVAPDHPESRLAVARASLDAQLWGQARNRLANLTAETVAPDIRVRAARMLAEVENHERGDSERAAAWLKMALETAPGPETRAAAPRSVAELTRA